MQHRRPDGSLAYGWFCSWCGQPVDMMGHLRYQREIGECNSNLELVVLLQRANTDPQHIKPRFIHGYKEKKT